MIWHIFKKDLRLLWPTAVVVAAVNWLNAGLLTSGGQFARVTTSAAGQYAWISNLVLPALSLLGLVILAVSAIQQDPFAGTTQDWLTRPVPRGRLLTAKMLFVIVLGLGPILVADLIMGVAAHLRVIEVIEASLIRGLVLYILVCLPAIMVGAVTRTLTQAVIFAVGMAVVLVSELIALAELKSQLLLSASGYAWTIVAVLMVATAMAAIVLLSLQLRWRSTNRVRWLLAVYLCVTPASLLLPWNAAFGIQQLVGDHVGESLVSVALDASRGVTFSYTDKRVPARLREMLTDGWLEVPINAAGNANEAWRVDHVRVRAIAPSMDESFEAPPNYLLSGLGAGFAAGNRSLFLNVPSGFLRRARDLHARIELTLVLTTFTLAAHMPLNSLDGASIDDFSRCRIRPAVLGKVLQCVSTRPVGFCVQFDPTSRDVHRRNPNIIQTLNCGQGYAPWALPLWRDPYYTIEFPAGDMEPFMVLAEGFDQPRSETRVLSNYLPHAHVLRSVEFDIAKATEGSTPESARSIDGTGAAARFAAPVDMIADSHGNLFIVDVADSVIRKVTPAGEASTFAGQPGQTGREDGRGPDARFKRPSSIAIDDSDNLYIVDAGNDRIRKISPAGVVSTVAATAGSGSNSARTGPFRNPTAIARTRDGTIYLIDHNEDGQAVVRKITPNGVVDMVAGPDAE